MTIVVEKQEKAKDTRRPNKTKNCMKFPFSFVQSQTIVISRACLAWKTGNLENKVFTRNIIHPTEYSMNTQLYF